MARTVENKDLHFPLDKGMDQSASLYTSPPGSLALVLNCRKRGPGGVLECRPGRSQLPSTCIGTTAHYIAGDDATGFVYRPCFVTRITDSPLLGTTAGEAFAYAGGLWNYCGRFSTCLPLKKHVSFSPTKLAPNSAAGGTIFPPQIAINSSGFRMSVAVDAAHTVQACIDSPDGVRQAITWSSSASVLAVRIVALGTKFILFWQAGTTISVNTYVPATGSGGVTYVEAGSVGTLASSSYYWDVTAGDASSAALCFAWGSADRTISLATLSSTLAVTHTATKLVGSGAIPMSLWVHPVDGNYWLGFNDASGGITGTDLNANVDTTTNKTLRIRTSKAAAYTVINVTSGAATAKTTIAADLNAAFGGAGLTLTASVVGTNQLKIVNTSTSSGVPGYLIDIDSVANGSNLNTAVGFPSGQSDTFGGSTYAIFSSVLAVVLAYATISSALGTATLGVSPYVAPLFGYYRDASQAASKHGQGMYAIGLFRATTSQERVTYMGVASAAGVVQDPCPLVNMIPATKPDNYGRLWVLLEAELSGFLVSRYALLRFFSLDVDASSGANIQLLSPPTVELVTDGFPSISSALYQDNSSGNFIGRFFSAIASDGDSYFAGIWAPVEEITGQTPGSTKTNTQPGGVLAQAQIYQYSAVEFDGSKHTHRDTDAVQQTVTISGQPVEIFGAPTAQLIYGIASATPSIPYAAGASEIGFLHPPVIKSTRAGDPSTTPAAGTYLYKAVFQWVDECGRRHQSAPSIPVSVTADGAHTTELFVYVIQCTQRQSRNNAQPVELIMYRTVVGGSQFHETTMRATVNDTTNGRLVQFIDDLSDANIQDNAFLYTDGGVLPNDIAPSCRFSCRSEERVWFGGLWDPTIIQCSKIIVPGEPIETPESDAFRVQLLRPCTGISYMDGQVIAFAKDAIFLINGDGPNDQGNGSFSVRPLTLTIGCVDYRSILETEAGVMFQSAHGVYLIPRGFAPPQYVGAAIQTEFGAFSGPDAPPEILSASYCQTNQGNLAKFLVSDFGGAIVYMMDVNTGEWFADFLADGAREMGYLTRSDDLAIGPGTLYAAPDFDNSSGAVSPVLYETLADRYDYPHVGTTRTAVSMEVDANYLFPFGLGGWGRFNALLGYFLTDTAGITCVLRCTVDNNTTETGVWTSDATTLNTVQYRKKQLANTQGSAASVILTLSPQDNTVAANYSAKFIGFSLEVEPSGGMRLMAGAEVA